MTIAPIVRSVQVKAAPARAFELFINHMHAWWPKGRTIGEHDHETITIEPKTGGRWYERDAKGNETIWGKVLAWDPPGRLLLGWQINSKWNHDPDFLTEVELTFVPLDGGGTLVTLEHRDLERFGDDAEKHAAALGGGWPTHLAQFAEYADTHL